MAMPLNHCLEWPASSVDRAMTAWWSSCDRPRRLAVACSGGADSVALLLAACRLIREQKALPVLSAPSPFEIVALHVHHGLQPAADAFVQHVQALATEVQRVVQGVHPQIAFSLQVRRVAVEVPSGCSLEARAREARYEALADMAHQVGSDVILLGHHADDQAESVLLALRRGAGVAGLAAMALHFERHGLRWGRPLLNLPGQELRTWLRRHDVSWIDDPSNTDLRFTRNRLRHEVLPAFHAAFPALRSSLARSARLAAEADGLLQVLAGQDLEQMGLPPQIDRLRKLARPRQANALRHWLKQQHGAIGSEAQLRALLDVIAARATRGHHIHIRVGQGYVEDAGPHLVWIADPRG